MRAENECSDGGASRIGKMALSEEAVEAGGCIEKTQEVRQCERDRGSKESRSRGGGVRLGVSRRGDIWGNVGAGLGGRSRRGWGRGCRGGVL